MIKQLERTFFKTDSRINRTQFLAYLFTYGAAMITLSLIISLLPKPFSVGANIFLLLCFIAILISLAIKRAHDFDEGMWFALLVIIPLANYYLVFEPGSPMPNRYGPVPDESSFGVKILALLSLIWPILLLPFIVFVPSVRQLFELQ